MDCFSTQISTLHLKKPLRTGIDGNKRPQTNSLTANVLITATTTIVWTQLSKPPQRTENNLSAEIATTVLFSLNQWVSLQVC